MRARLAVDASGQQCELREIVLRDKPEEMLKASPKGTVPVLIDTDDVVIDESLDIMLWALHRNDPEEWLGQDEKGFDSMLALIRQFDTEFKPHLDRFKYPNRFEGANAIDSRSEASRHIDELESRLQTTRYLFGERIRIADMAIAPFVRQFANVDAAWFASQPWTAVQRWLKDFTDSPRFARVMHTFDVWKPGTPGVRFPF
jgi:glutathione S-transferase